MIHGSPDEGHGTDRQLLQGAAGHSPGEWERPGLSSRLSNRLANPSTLAIAAGVVLAGGAAYLAARRLAEASEGPEYRTLYRQGDFEIRDYAAIVVAETVKPGYHETARQRGSDVLLAYCSGQNGRRERIFLALPLMQQLSGSGRGPRGWAIRVIMPRGLTLPELPSPLSADVRLTEIPARRIAAIRFAGRFTASLAAKKLLALYDHLGEMDLDRADPQYAFYDPPWIPGPARRNEIWVEIPG